MKKIFSIAIRSKKMESHSRTGVHLEAWRAAGAKRPPGVFGGGQSIISNSKSGPATLLGHSGRPCGHRREFGKVCGGLGELGEHVF